MMSMFYSPSTRGFYTPGQKGTPGDAVKITAKRHAALLEKQAAGEEIVVRGGKITTRPIKAKWENIRAARNRKLARSDWSQLPDAQAAMPPDRAEAWRAYRQALRDLPATFDSADDVIWPREPDARRPSPKAGGNG